MGANKKSKMMYRKGRRGGCPPLPTARAVVRYACSKSMDGDPHLEMILSKFRDAADRTHESIIALGDKKVSEVHDSNRG